MNAFLTGKASAERCRPGVRTEDIMRKPPTIGEFSLAFALSPSSRRGVYTVTRGGAPTPYTIEKHALWCLFLHGKALPIGRYARMEEALAAAVSHMGHRGRRSWQD
jgi:hypothetical protein